MAHTTHTPHTTHHTPHTTPHHTTPHARAPASAFFCNLLVLHSFLSYYHLSRVATSASQWLTWGCIGCRSNPRHTQTPQRHPVIAGPPVSSHTCTHKHTHTHPHTRARALGPTKAPAYVRCLDAHSVLWTYMLAMMSAAIPYHTTPHHTIPCHTTPYHTIPYHTMGVLPSTQPVATLGYHTIPYHTIPHHAMPCHAMPCQ